MKKVNKDKAQQDWEETSKFFNLYIIKQIFISLYKYFFLFFQFKFLRFYLRNFQKLYLHFLNYRFEMAANNDKKENRYDENL